MHEVDITPVMGHSIDLELSLVVAGVGARAVRATSTTGAYAPVVTASRTGQVQAVTATGNAAARVPQAVGGSSSAFVTTDHAPCTAGAFAPVVSGDASVSATIATASTTARAPSTPSNTAVNAALSIATSKAAAPTISGEVVLTGGGPGTGSYLAYPPTVSGSGGPQLMGTLIDNFDSGTLSAALEKGGGDGSLITPFNGGYKVAHPATALGNYNRIQSVGTYSLVGSYAYVQVNDYGNQALAHHDVLFRVAVDDNNLIEFYANQNVLWMRYKVAGVLTNVSSVTLNGTVHRWLKIREQSGTIFYDTSVDGKTWVNRASVATPITITALQLLMICGNGFAEGASFAVFDNLNAVPLMGTLRDNFDSGTVSPALIIRGGDTSLVTASGGGMRIAHPATAQGDYNRIQSIDTYDMTGSYASIQVVDYGNQALPNHGVFLRVCPLDDDSNVIEFFAAANVLNMQYKVAGTLTILLSTALNTTTHNWLRIRESGGTTFWDTSDGVTWTNRASHANPFAVTAMQVKLMCGDFLAEGASAAIFDNLNGG